VNTCEDTYSGALANESQVCWIAPNNVVCLPRCSWPRCRLTRCMQRVNQVFGVRSGMGLSVLTFDWNQIAFLGSRERLPNVLC
jgi:hypothetical protein